MTYAAGVAITTAATSAYITDITRRARYGAAHGVFGTIYDVGDALGPIAAGVLVAWLGYAHMFQVMAVVAIMMAVVFAIRHGEAAISSLTHARPERSSCTQLRKGTSMRRLGFAALMAAGIVVMGHAETRKVDFTQDAVDQPPKGFEFGHTAGVGKPGRWIVQADGTNKVLAQADPDSTRSRFPVACCPM